MSTQHLLMIEDDARLAALQSLLSDIGIDNGAASAEEAAIHVVIDEGDYDRQ